MKNTTEPRPETSPMDLPLETVVACWEDWKGEYNTLLWHADTGQFYLADTVPPNDRPLDTPVAVTLVEAARWFVRIQGFNSGYNGEPSILVDALADALE